MKPVRFSKTHFSSVTFRKSSVRCGRLRSGLPFHYAERTIAAYRMHAPEAARSWSRARTPSRFLRRFAALLPPGGRVLDYGCGIGADLAWLRRQGFRAEGVDGTLEFVQEARRRSPGAKVLHARFEMVPLGRREYDGIWCSAALIHVPPEALAGQMEKLRLALRPGGRLALTLAWGRRKGFLRGDWIPGRYVAGFTKQEALKRLGGWVVQSVSVVSGESRRGRWIQIFAQPSEPLSIV